MAEELTSFNPDLEVEQIPSSGGVFEVVYDGTLVYSKKANGRFPEKGEVVAALQK